MRNASRSFVAVDGDEWRISHTLFLLTLDSGVGLGSALELVSDSCHRFVAIDRGEVLCSSHCAEIFLPVISVGRTRTQRRRNTSLVQG